MTDRSYLEHRRHKEAQAASLTETVWRDDSVNVDRFLAVVTRYWRVIHSCGVLLTSGTPSGSGREVFDGACARRNTTLVNNESL